MSSKGTINPRKRPKQARSRATVDAILEAAAQVFCAHGYAGGTTDRVAERAGVSIGSLYQYFPNKESLLLSLATQHMDEGFDLIHRLLAEVAKSQPALKIMLRQFVEALIELHDQAPQLHRVLFNEAPLPPAFVEEKEAREAEFAEKLQLLLAAYPEIQVRNTALAAYMLVQTIEGLVHSFVLFPPKGLAKESLTDEMVNMLYSYLTSTQE